MQRAFVFDNNKQPLMPCNVKRARELLKQGKAAIYRCYPFTIILKKRTGGITQPLEVKIDPGSKTTGIALALSGKQRRKVIWAANLEHRGYLIQKAIEKRRSIRRNRRSRKLGYRPARFDNRKRPTGWLPPSLMSMVENISSWVKRIIRFAPVTDIAVETVRFDTQQLQISDISGVQYQQGTLFGYEVKEYLLEKWQRTCVYCDAKNIRLEIEHIVPKSRGGSNRASNLILSCKPCNIKKGALNIQEYLATDQKRLEVILKQIKLPLKDAAAVNATRYAIGKSLKELNIPTTFWTGAKTKFNRAKQAYLKDHWVDAACVGDSGASVYIPPELKPLFITATGRGKRQMCRADRYGFPRTSAKAHKQVYGFKTGDLVTVNITKGNKIGKYKGRVAVRAAGNFNIKTVAAMLQGVHFKYCKVLQHGDGYNYRLGDGVSYPN